MIPRYKVFIKYSFNFFTRGEADYYELISLLVKCFIRFYHTLSDIKIKFIFSFVFMLNPSIYNLIDEFIKNNFCHGILTFIYSTISSLNYRGMPITCEIIYTRFGFIRDLVNLWPCILRSFLFLNWINTIVLKQYRQEDQQYFYEEIVRSFFFIKITKVYNILKW